MQCKKPHLSAGRSYCKYKCRCKRCKRYAAGRRDYVRKWRLQKRYGLSDEQYKALGNRCHICGSNTTGMRRAKHLFVDHDHETNKVRGLLCNKCNLGIANFDDSVLLMSSAIAYLYKHKYNSEAYVGSTKESFERSNK